MLAIAGLCLAATGFVGMQPIFWTLPTEYMTGYAAAAVLIVLGGAIGGRIYRLHDLERLGR